MHIAVVLEAICIIGVEKNLEANPVTAIVNHRRHHNMSNHVQYCTSLHIVEGDAWFTMWHPRPVRRIVIGRTEGLLRAYRPPSACVPSRAIADQVHRSETLRGELHVIAHFATN